MIHLRSFTVTHKPMTNTKPYMVRIYDNRYKKTYYASYHETKLDRQEDIAQEWLSKRGIICTTLTEGKRGFIILTSSFKPIES